MQCESAWKMTDQSCIWVSILHVISRALSATKASCTMRKMSARKWLRKCV